MKSPLYPPQIKNDKNPLEKKYGNVDVSATAFGLRINGKKQVLSPVSPGTVAATLQNSDWQSGPRLEGEGGMGNTGVILGRPVPQQVPGGQQPPQPRRIPGAPPQDDPGGIAPERRVTAPELVVQTGLPEGHFRGAVSGFLYFPYRGRSSSIKTLDLLYEDAVLKLR